MTSDLPDSVRVDNSDSRSYSRLRRRLTNLTVLAVTLAICALLIELGVRLLFPFFRPDRQVYFQRMTNGMVIGPPLKRMRQSTPKGDFNLDLHFNKYGLRDSKDLGEATTNDWFAIGDSFTFGWGVSEEERFSSLIHAALKTSGSPERVFNISAPDNLIGYQRMVTYAESFGAKVRRVIIGVCMENDLHDYRAGHSDWDDASPREPVSRKDNVRMWIRSRSAVYVAVSFWLQQSDGGRNLLQRLGIARSVDDLTSKNIYNDVALQTSRDELSKLLTNRQAVILLIPSRRLWHGDHIATEQQVHDEFVRLLREAGVPFVDMRPVFEASGQPLSYYFVSDAHWNAAGHAAAAREVFKAMTANCASGR